MDAPVIPQPDWPTEEEMLRIELECYGPLVKTATDLKARRQEEMALLTAFKSKPSQETFVPLYRSFKPLIINAAQKNMFGSPLPKAAHMALAAQSFLDATRTFDPKKGGSFKTHAYGTIQEKGKRLNLKYQNIGYIPEARATKYQQFQTAAHLLREQLGREPSTTEIADELMLPEREIERLRKEIRDERIMKEHMVHKGGAFAQSDRAMQVARDVHGSLEPKHRLVLEYTLGLFGRPSLVKRSGKADIAAIAKAAGLSIADVRSARKTIYRKFKDYTGFMGKAEGDYAAFSDEEGD